MEMVIVIVGIVLVWLVFVGLRTARYVNENSEIDREIDREIAKTNEAP
jgi:4-hydroxybenzoate polyprenyltransferase